LGYAEAYQEFGRLEEDRHLVTVVLASVVKTVQGRSDRSPKDRRTLDEAALFIPA
jgi:hypothetical protein